MRFAIEATVMWWLLRVAREPKIAPHACFIDEILVAERRRLCVLREVPRGAILNNVIPKTNVTHMPNTRKGWTGHYNQTATIWRKGLCGQFCQLVINDELIDQLNRNVSRNE